MDNILAFINGAQTAQVSQFTKDNQPLKAFDKDKIIKQLRLMPQKQIDAVFTEIVKLQHYKDVSEGAWCCDKDPQEIAEGLNETNSFEEREIVIKELMFRLKYQ